MKVTVHTLTPLFAIACRAVILLSFNSYMLVSSQLRLDIPNPLTFRLLVGRAAMSTVTFAILMASVEFVPIAIVNSLYYMGPIFIFFIEGIFESVHLSVIVEINKMVATSIHLPQLHWGPPHHQALVPLPRPTQRLRPLPSLAPHGCRLHFFPRHVPGPQV